MLQFGVVVFEGGSGPARSRAWVSGSLLVIVLIGLFNYFLVPFVLTNGSGAPGGATNFYALYFFRVGFQFFEMGYAATLAWGLFIVAVLVTGILFWSAKYWVHYEYSEG